MTKENTGDQSLEKITERIPEDFKKSILEIAECMVNSSTDFLSRIEKSQFKRFLLSYSDLNSIRERILNQLSSKKTISQKETVNIQYVDGKIISLASWEEFSRHDTGEHKHIVSIHMSMEYHVLSLATEISEKIKIQISARTVIPKSEKVFVEIFEHGSKLSNIRYSINYQNYVDADNISNTIEGWIKSLEEVNFSWHFPFLQKNSTIELINSFMKNSSYFIAIFIAIYFIDKSIIDTDIINFLIKFPLYIMATMIIVGPVFLFLSQQVTKWIQMTDPISFIIIGRGDKNFLEQRKIKNR